MGHRCCGKQKVKRGLWSPEEDERLLKHITCEGHGNWSSVPKLAGLQRCGKSCRLRWINYLRPDLKRGSFTPHEEQIIIDVHRILGNRWAQIAKHLPGRTDNEVKNFWNSCIKKKLISQGLDPTTHNLLSPHQRATLNITPTNPVLNLHQQSSSSSSSLLPFDHGTSTNLITSVDHHIPTFLPQADDSSNLSLISSSDLLQQQIISTYANDNNIVDHHETGLFWDGTLDHRAFGLAAVGPEKEKVSLFNNNIDVDQYQINTDGDYNVYEMAAAIDHEAAASHDQQQDRDRVDLTFMDPNNSLMYGATYDDDFVPMDDFAWNF